jgi:hypothetical protein
MISSRRKGEANKSIRWCVRMDGFGIGKDPPILSTTWVRLSELASAEAMRVAIRRVRALVRRNGPTFSSSPSIFVCPGSPSAEGRQILRAAGDWKGEGTAAAGRRVRDGDGADYLVFFYWAKAFLDEPTGWNLRPVAAHRRH